MRRAIEEQVKKRIKPGKVILIQGGVGIGKKRFMEDVASDLALNSFTLQSTALMQHLDTLERMLSNNKLLIIPEAQNIPDIASCIARILSANEHLSILASISSTFDVREQFNAHLKGAKTTFQLFPITLVEKHSQKIAHSTQGIEEDLIYGSYPAIFEVDDKSEWLKEHVSITMLADPIKRIGVHQSVKLLEILQYMAHRIGTPASMQEIGQLLGISKNTATKYVQMLMDSFVIFPLGGFNRSLKKELTKNRKWYFYDNGIRNAVINDLRDLKERNDVEMLWENFLQSERLKQISYSRLLSSSWYWRTYDKQSLPRVEEKSGMLTAYSFNWNEHRRTRTPLAWKKAYPYAEVKVIDRSNYLEWLS